jgi:CubicO group peptidase (beta-lactamase class C family)
VVVPPGTRHAYKNGGSDVAHIVCHARPPSTLQEFLEDAAALGRAGKVTHGGLPKTPTALLQAAVLVHAYRDMVVLGFPPLPPPAIQRLVFPALARLGERRGYKAGRITG